MTIQIKAYGNSDSTTVVWRSDGHIQGCLGFALHRRGSAAGDVVIENRVGFAGAAGAGPGQHQSSDVWPIQRMVWSDYSAGQAGTVQYRVVAKLGQPGALKDGPASDWSDPVVVGTGKTQGFQAYFNRGIVPAQYDPGQLGAQSAQGKASIAPVDLGNANDPLRAELSGVLRIALVGELTSSQGKGETIYAALYELNDPELIAALKKYGKNCNLLLGSGAFGTKTIKGKKVKVTDENAAVRQQLRASHTINVYDRLVTAPHFAHNKFVVFCDATGPQRVWTGSTNWTVSGLCTQVNNGILVDSPALAQAYLSRWNTLKAAGNGYPPNVASQGSTPARTQVGSTAVTAWNVPCLKLVDLADARRLIQGARQGVLFLFFNPGPKGTLLNDILALDQDKLYIHGVANQDPGGGKAPILTLHDRGNRIDAEPEVSLPKNLNAPLNAWFRDEPAGPLVMIHSKVVVVDPFGQHPVVMTGSHNMGPKASAENDDNLLIVENAPGLAQEYAVNIMGVFDHYKFRQAHHVATAKTGKAVKPAPAPAPAASPAPAWGGLQAKDNWQDDYLQPARMRELDFWFGDFRPAAPGPATAQHLDQGPTPASSPAHAGRKPRTAKVSSPKKPSKRKPAKASRPPAKTRRTRRR